MRALIFFRKCELTGIIMVAVAVACDGDEAQYNHPALERPFGHAAMSLHEGVTRTEN